MLLFLLFLLLLLVLELRLDPLRCLLSRLFQRLLSLNLLLSNHSLYIRWGLATGETEVAASISAMSVVLLLLLLLLRQRNRRRYQYVALAHGLRHMRRRRWRR